MQHQLPGVRQLLGRYDDLTNSASGGGDAVLNATKCIDMDESYTLFVPSAPEQLRTTIQLL